MLVDTIKTNSNEVEDLVYSYYLARKFNDNDFKYEVNNSDYSIYDAWDYDNPSCKSFIITGKNYLLKASINSRDGECILEIIDKNNEDAYNFLNSFYYDNIHRKEIVRSVRCSGKVDSYNFLGYFGLDNYSKFYEILHKYVSFAF